MKKKDREIRTTKAKRHMADVQALWFFCNLPQNQKTKMERKEAKEELMRTNPCVSGLPCRSWRVRHSTPDPLKLQVNCRQRNTSRHPASIRTCLLIPLTHRAYKYPTHPPPAKQYYSHCPLCNTLLIVLQSAHLKKKWTSERLGFNTLSYLSGV